MKFGICDSDFERIPVAAEAGIDYVEMSTTGMLMPLEPDEAFEPMRQRIAQLPVRPEAFNLFFPRTVRVTGPQVDWDLVQRYVAKAVERCASVGGKVMVVGSGGARHVPEGFSWDEAWEQLRYLFTLMGSLAAKWDITIAIEPLRRPECNILNLVSEGVRMARQVNHPNIKVLADFYHMSEEEEPLSHILDAGDLLAHIHVADTGRLWPGSGSYDYPTFFHNLKKIGYDARISMEGNWSWDNLREDCRNALAFMRKVWESV